MIAADEQLQDPQQPQQPQKPIVPPDRVGRERFLKEMEAQLQMARNQQDLQFHALMETERQQKALQDQQGAEAQQRGAMEQSEMLLNRMRTEAPRMPEMSEGFDAEMDRLGPLLPPERVQQLRITKQRLMDFNAMLPDIDARLKAAMAPVAQQEGIAKPDWEATMFERGMNARTIPPVQPGQLGTALVEGLASPFTGTPLSARERVLQSMQEAAKGIVADYYPAPAPALQLRGNLGLGGPDGTRFPEDSRGVAPPAIRRAPEGTSKEALQGVVADRMQALLERETNDRTTAQEFTRHVGSALGWVIPFSAASKVGGALTRGVGLAEKALEGGRAMKALEFGVRELAVPGAAVFAWGTQRELGPEDRLKVDQAPAKERETLESALHLRRGMQEGLLMPLYAAHMGGAGTLLRKSPVLRGLLVGATAPAVGEAGEAITHGVATVAKEMGFESGEALADYYAAKGVYGPIGAFLRDPSWANAKAYAAAALPQMTAFGALGLMHRVQDKARLQTRKEMLEAAREAHGEIDRAVDAGQMEPEVAAKLKQDVTAMAEDLAPSHAEDRARVAKERHEEAAGGEVPAKAEAEDRMQAAKLEHLPGETLAEKRAAAEQRFGELDAKTERTPAEEAELKALPLEGAAIEHLQRGEADRTSQKAGGGVEARARARQLIDQAKRIRSESAAEAPVERDVPFQEPEAAAAAANREAIQEAAAGPLPETKAREAAVAARKRPPAEPKPAEPDPLVDILRDRLKGQQRVSVPWAMKELGVGRTRSERVLAELEKQGHVYREGQVRRVRDLEAPMAAATERDLAVTGQGGTKVTAESRPETPPAGHPVQLHTPESREAAKAARVARLRKANQNRPRNLVTAIRKLGGISASSWDTTYPGNRRKEWRIPGVVTKRGGMTWEQMAEALANQGYGPGRDVAAAAGGSGAGGRDTSWLVDALTDAAQGVHHYREEDAAALNQAMLEREKAREAPPGYEVEPLESRWLKGLQTAEKQGNEGVLNWLRDNLQDVRDYLSELGELRPADQALQDAVESAIARFQVGSGLPGPSFIGSPSEVWFHLTNGAHAIFRFLRGGGAFARQRFLNERTVRTEARKVKGWLDQFRGAIGLYGSAGAEGVTAIEQSYRMRERMQQLVLKLEKDLGGADSDLDHALTLAVESFSRSEEDRSPAERAAWQKLQEAGKGDLPGAVREALAEVRKVSASRHPVSIAMHMVIEARQRGERVLEGNLTEAQRQLEQAKDDKAAKKAKRRVRAIERDLKFQRADIARWQDRATKFTAEWGRTDYMPHVPDPQMLKDLQGETERLNIETAAAPILKMAGHWRRRQGALEASGTRDPSAVRSLWHYLTQVAPLATMTDYEVRNEGAIYGNRRALSHEEVVQGGPGQVEYIEGRDVLRKRNRGQYWEVSTDGAKPKYVRSLEEIPAELREGARTRKVVILDDMAASERGAQIHPEAVGSKPGRFTVISVGQARRSLFMREGGLMSELGQAKRDEYEAWHRQVHKIADESAGLADFGVWDRFARRAAHILSAKDIAAFHPGPAIRNLIQTLILNGHRLGVRRAMATIHLPLSMAARLHAAVKSTTVANLLKGVEATELGAHTPMRNTELARLLGTSPRLLARMSPKRRAEAELYDEAMRELLDSPAFTSSIVHDLDGAAAGGGVPGERGFAGKVAQWLPLIGSRQWALFRGAESYSRWHLFLDGYVQARQHGMEPAAARQHANDAVLGAHGFMNRAARSQFMQVPFFRAALYMSGWMQHAGGTLVRAMTKPDEKGRRRVDVAGLRHAAMYATYLIGVQQLAQAFLQKDWSRLVGGTLSEVPFVGAAADYQARKVLDPLSKGLEAVGLPLGFQGEIPVPVLPGTWGLAAAPIVEHGAKALAAWYQGDAKTAGGEWDRFASRLLPNWLRTYRRSFEGEENPEHPGTHFTKEWATGRRIETLPGDLSLGSGAYRALTDMFGPDLDEQRRWRLTEQDRMRQEIGAAERRSQGYRLGLTAREMTQLDRARKQPGGDTPERQRLAKQLEKQYEDQLVEIAQERNLRTKGQVSQLNWETLRTAQMDQQLTASQRRILNAPTLDERVRLFSRSLNDPSYPLTAKEATEILTLMVGKAFAEGKSKAFERWLQLVPPDSAKELVDALNQADKRWRKPK